jgi:hypothetical protein
MVFAGFPKKIRNKTFYFQTKKKLLHYYFILSFGPRVHFRGQKLTFWQKKSPPKKFKNSKIQKFKNSKILTTLFISLKVAHSAQEAPKKISARWLIKKLKTIEVGFKGG